MKQALGQLPNAPLIYVLAQILFTRVPKMADIWEDFHQRVFDLYPESGVAHVEQFTIKKENGVESSKETRWNMFSRDRRKGLILNANALILHTTSYTTSADFFTDLEVALGHLVEVLPSSIQVSRLGLRYIDLLLPGEYVDVEKQVVDKLWVPNFESLGCRHMRSERITRYNTSLEGELILRYRQTMDRDVLPSDIFPNDLEPASLLTTSKPENAEVASLDFDHFLKKDMPLEQGNIIRIFRELHKTTSEVFHAITTEAARQKWGEMNNAS